MPYFTVRVELHGAYEQDYEVLHVSMQAHGFNRTIQCDNGRGVYHLPPAEYVVIGNYADQAVLNAAKIAAAATGRPFAVLVSRAESLAWSGLPRVG